MTTSHSARPSASPPPSPALTSEAGPDGCFRAVPVALVVWGVDGRVIDLNDAAVALLGCAREHAIGAAVNVFWPASRGVLPGDQGVEHALRHASGEHVPVLVSTAAMTHLGLPCRVSSFHDLRERKRLELDLLHARKLEAVGQLAAGVAHELNTPIQFVSDNLHFLRDAVADLLDAVDALTAIAADPAPAAAREAATRVALTEHDLDYLRPEAPDAIARSLGGLDRVASIVRALKSFAHPRSGTHAADLHAELETTLVIARNEYKYVADVVTDFGELPRVRCDANQLNQVFLNLIVNAAHAIHDAGRGRGTITIATRRDGAEHVLISVSDTGDGVPEAARERVFEPFFTTKQVGRGTGQGLSVSRQIVVEHGGTLSFESQPGRGATFLVRLPIASRRVPETRF